VFNLLSFSNCRCLQISIWVHDAALDTAHSTVCQVIKYHFVIILVVWWRLPEGSSVVCLHGSKLSPLRFFVSSPVSLQKHHCWHSTRLNLMCFKLYLGCFNEPLSNLSRYDCIYTSSQVYFEMVQLKKISGKWKIFCFRNLSPVDQKSIFGNKCGFVQCARNLCCSLYLTVAQGL